jgi:hypothetical protein
VEIDHVLLAARVLAADAKRIAHHLGLESYEGGRHPAWGTANWIVPLGTSYLELIRVVDERKASGSDFGSWVSASSSGTLVGWAVRPGSLEATARRLGLEIGEGSRAGPSGERIEWRTAGITEAVCRPWLPFFIEWRDPAAHPGRTRSPGAVIERVEIEGDRAELDRWLGEHQLPLAASDGTTGLTAIDLRGPRGTATIGRGTSF